MTELRVKPDRESDEENVNKCYILLSLTPILSGSLRLFKSPNLQPRFAANYRLRTSDALQAATAIQAQATAFLTHNPVFERVSRLGALVLDRFV